MHQSLPFHLFVALAIFISGCTGGSVATPEQGDVFTQLNDLQQCYVTFSETNGRPPNSVDELKELMSKRGLDANNFLTSKNDGKPFVIHWGAKSSPTTSMSPLVIAYEAEGKAGKRMVMTSMGVMEMSEKELSESQFPKGFSFTQ